VIPPGAPGRRSAVRAAVRRGRRRAGGEEASGTGERLVLAVVASSMAPARNWISQTAEFLLVVLLGAEAIHDRRTGDEHREISFTITE